MNTLYACTGYGSLMSLRWGWYMKNSKTKKTLPLLVIVMKVNVWKRKAKKGCNFLMNFVVNLIKSPDTINNWGGWGVGYNMLLVSPHFFFKFPLFLDDLTTLIALVAEEILGQIFLFVIKILHSFWFFLSLN